MKSVHGQKRKAINRRAISHILSVMMMTLITTALSTTVLYWGLTEIGESRTTLSGAMESRMDRIKQSIVIEDVKRISDTSIRIYVRNIGAVHVIIDTVYVNHTAATSLSPEKLSLAVQEVSYMDAVFSLSDFPDGFSAGTTQLVRVPTTRGASDVGYWTL